MAKNSACDTCFGMRALKRNVSPVSVVSAESVAVKRKSACKCPNALTVFRPLTVLMRITGMLPVSLDSSAKIATWKKALILLYTALIGTLITGSAIRVNAYFFHRAITTMNITDDYIMDLSESYMGNMEALVYFILIMTRVPKMKAYLEKWNSAHDKMSPCLSIGSKFSGLRVVVYTSVILALVLFNFLYTFLKEPLRYENRSLANLFPIDSKDFFKKLSDNYIFLTNVILLFCQSMPVIIGSWIPLFLAFSLHRYIEKYNTRMAKVITASAWQNGVFGKLRQEHNVLCQLVDSTNQFISPIVFFIVVLNIVSITLSLYSIQKLLSFSHEALVVGSVLYLLQKILLFNATLYHCHCVHEEIHLPINELLRIERKRLSEPDTSELDAFLLQLRARQYGIDGLKYFLVTRSMVVAIFSGILSYIIILIQFHSC